MFRLNAFYRHSISGNCTRDQKRAGFNSVRNNVVFRAVQLRHAFDDDPPVPAPSIFAPILLRKFARSTTSGSHAAPSMTVTPSANTAAIITLSVPRTVGPNFPRSRFAPRGQFRREDLDIAAFHPHRGAERFKTFQMQINRPIANDTAAGQRDASLPCTGPATVPKRKRTPAFCARHRKARQSRSSRPSQSPCRSRVPLAHRDAARIWSM